MSGLYQTNQIRNLSLAKQIYYFALRLASRGHSAQDRIMAVISFDLAIENALRLVIAHFDKSFRLDSDSQFPKLVQNSDNILIQNSLGSLPEKSRIQEVHSIRNDAQHNSRIPSSEEVTYCKTNAREFLQSITPLVWKIEFDDIRLSSLIQNDKLRAMVEGAEQLVHEGEFQKAIDEAFNALDYAFYRIRSYSPLTGPMLVTGITEIEDMSARQAIQNIQTSLSVIALGLNYFDLLENQAKKGKKNPTAQDAESVIAYIIDSVMHIEAVVGDIMTWWN